MIRYSSKDYKKYTLALLVAAAIALVVCAAAFALKRDAVLAAQGVPEPAYESYYSPKPAASQENGNQAAISQESRPSPTFSPSPSATPAGQYLVSVHEGKIGVFQRGEPVPFLLADVQVYLLPREDQDLLKKGIRADSLAEVRRILEDYE